jgi:hypothetical protein
LRLESPFIVTKHSIHGIFDIPIIPVFALSSLEKTLENFLPHPAEPPKSSPSLNINPTVALLPYCTIKPPVPDHQQNQLMENCHSIADLAQVATTAEGQDWLRMVSEPSRQVAEDMIAFWEQEYCLGD